MANALFQSDPKAPGELFWQRGRGLALVTALMFTMLTLVTVGMAAIGVGLLMAAMLTEVLFGVAMLALACVLARMSYLVFRVIEGVGPAEVRLRDNAVYLALPAWRSIIHRPARYSNSVPFADIESLETRLESYGGQVQRTSRLRLKNGDAVFLFDEGYSGTAQWGPSYYLLLQEIADRASVPLRDLGMVEGAAAPLMAWAATPIDWDADPVSPSAEARIWGRARIIGGAVAILTAIVLIAQSIAN